MKILIHEIKFRINSNYLKNMKTGRFYNILTDILILSGLILFSGCDEEITMSNSLPSETYGTFTDSRDNINYKTLTINGRTWMAENLAYIPHVSKGKNGGGIWVYDFEGSDVDSAKATDNYQTYGCLYDWKTANEVCPAGWHLPSDEEWSEFTSFIDKDGYEYSDGAALKASSGWMEKGGFDAYDFHALPAGSRGIDGSFYYIKGMTSFWSSTEKDDNYAWIIRLDHTKPDIMRRTNIKLIGYSVRCIQDYY